MNDIAIRQFQYTDLNDAIRIAQVSFAKEFLAQGLTPEGFAREIKTTARGRMIPFRILSALAGFKWMFLVAETDEKVVGIGTYSGRKRMHLSGLMVDPDYRRRGIGQALLVERLRRIMDQGYPFATADILTTNEASLGNVGKQGFEIFDRYSVFETPLPLEENKRKLAGAITHRPVKKSDRAVFSALEKQIADPVVLQVRDSAALRFFPSFGSRLMNRLEGMWTWARAFENAGHHVGFLYAWTTPNHTKGLLRRPVLSDAEIVFLPAMLREAASWFTQMGKTAMRITVPDTRLKLIECLQSCGWVKTVSWVSVIKWLDESARPKDTPSS
jgi:ribosomal protein S18 acetylase RimI-like enzyme